MWKKNMNREDVAQLIERFLENKSEYPQEWNDFVDTPQKDSVIEKYRRQCDELDPFVNRPEAPEPDAVARLKRIVDRLRSADEMSTDMPVKYCFEIMTLSERGQRRGEAMKRCARVFIARSGSRAIAVEMHINENDVWYEDGTPAVLNEPFTAEELGNAIAEAMGRTARRARDLRAHKLSDWSAYKASGEKSVRRFEDSYIEIYIEGANAANLVAIITGDPEKNAVLQIRSSISTGVVPAELGERVLHVYEACRDRRV